MKFVSTSLAIDLFHGQLVFLISDISFALFDQDVREMTSEGSNTETLAPVEPHLYEVIFNQVSFPVLDELIFMFNLNFT